MRKFAILLALAPLACTVAPRPAAPAVDFHALTAEEEAQVLALEDRRQYDPALVAQWSQSPNILRRARIALALGRIGPHTFADANGNGERDPGEVQAGVTELTKLATDQNANVRTTAAFALGEIGDASTIDTLF